MALVIPGSTVTTANADHAAETNTTNRSILVRDGVYLATSGTGANAVYMGATNGTATIDGYLYARNADAFVLSSSSTAVIGEEGTVAAETNTWSAIVAGSGAVLTNNGAILSQGVGIETLVGSNILTNNGSISSESNAVELDFASVFTNNGSVDTLANAVYVTGSSNINNVITNTGSITAGGYGVILVNGNSNEVTNSGAITSLNDGIYSINGLGHLVQNSGTISSGANGLTMGASNHRVINTGTISGDLSGAVFNGTQTAGNHQITNFGVISGEVGYGLYLGQAGSSIDNSGTISGYSAGIHAQNIALVPGNFGAHHVSNSGTITSLTSHGIELHGYDNKVTNSGAITAQNTGVYMIGRGNVTNTETGVITATHGEVVTVSHPELGGRAVIANAGQFISLNGGGVFIDGSNALVHNSGTMTTADMSIRLYKGGNIIRNSGEIASGDQGIWADYSRNVIVNSGDITAYTQAVHIGSTGGGEGVLRNSGSLVSETFTTLAIQTGTNTGEVYNSGSILNSEGIGVQMIGTADNLLRNTGDIVAGTYALLGGSGAETLRNLGTMDGDVSLSGGHDWVVNGGSIAGDVDLGAGDDTYRGKGAGAVSGAVSGGDGNDFLRGSGADDTLDGGNNNDTIYGRGGDDVILGGIGQDALFGGDGDDTLSGGDWSDTLNGGRGDDALTGGAAADTFVIIRNAGHDVITDFQNGSDKIDLSAFGLRSADYATIVAPALTGAGNGATLLDLDALGGSGSLLIEGLFLGQANAADFIL